MAQAERRADVVWEGNLLQGSGKTSPEELLAAAHAACYAMAFSHALAQGVNPPERLEVSATVGFDPKPGGGGFYVSGSKLAVRGRVPGMDQAAFEAAARPREQGCPNSNPN